MAVHLVRHAKAGNRGEGDSDSDDEARPLSKAGWAQVDGLVAGLAQFPITRVLSSRYVRCWQTAEPIAKKLGVEVEEHNALAEESSIGQSWKLVEKLLHADGDSVLCSHGNILGAVLDRVRRRGVTIDAKEWICPKGSIWRLESDDDGTLVRAVLAFNPKE
jgi:broad specificity phosphatase PhoE